jgi:uncharacterized protein YndB with AHSA1/START domain
MPASFRSDRSWRFDVTPDEFWSVVSRPEDFPQWWTWLSRLEAADGLREGARAICVVRPPLPYDLRFTLLIERVVPCQLVQTQVTGDISGPARLEIAPNGHGCTARLVWELQPASTLLRTISRVARPVMVWGHDRVLELGVRQFRDRALERPPPRP